MSGKAADSDIEFALLVEVGLVDGETVLTTTVHEMQVLERDLPETEHDFRVDRIVTPARVIRATARWRPTGIYWSHLDEEKIAAVPVLARLAAGERPTAPRGVPSS